MNFGELAHELSGEILTLGCGAGFACGRLHLPRPLSSFTLILCLKAHFMMRYFFKFFAPNHHDLTPEARIQNGILV
jgi:hypothetical protein